MLSLFTHTSVCHNINKEQKGYDIISFRKVTNRNIPQRMRIKAKSFWISSRLALLLLSHLFRSLFSMYNTPSLADSNWLFAYFDFVPHLHPNHVLHRTYHIHDDAKHNRTSVHDTETTLIL